MNQTVEQTMKKVGLVGWRGMVGSVLLERMQQENDFDNTPSSTTHVSHSVHDVI